MNTQTLQHSLRYTYDDYLQLPEEKRFELIQGDLVMVPSPITEHQRISLRLVRVIENYLCENPVGELFIAPFDVVLSPTDVVQPDLLFISESRRSIVTEKNVQGAPDWVIEILSPESARRDLGLKKKLYANHGVREYWVADPSSRTIQVFTLGEQGYELVETAAEGGAASCRLLPGLIAEHASVFRSE